MPIPIEICSHFCLTAGVGGAAGDLILLKSLYVEVGNKQFWIMDSAMSNHFLATKEDLTDFTPIFSVKIMTGNSIIFRIRTWQCAVENK